MEITKELTIPKLFLERVAQYGKSKVAMREKEFGIWKPITWHDYLENVKYTALGLISLGMKPGDKIP
jgi:long-chain acyl-CoA synthetase